MKKELKTSIIINASKERVWNILLDFEKYSEWNPFIKSISGNPQKGEKLVADIGNMKFKPQVLVNTQYQELRWLGKLLFKGLFDGEHQFILTENKNGSINFGQNEKFSGILVRLFSKKLDIETKAGFEAMNKALKERSEMI